MRGPGWGRDWGRRGGSDRAPRLSGVPSRQAPPQGGCGVGLHQAKTQPLPLVLTRAQLSSPLHITLAVGGLENTRDRISLVPGQPETRRGTGWFQSSPRDSNGQPGVRSIRLINCSGEHPGGWGSKPQPPSPSGCLHLPGGRGGRPRLAGADSRKTRVGASSMHD